MKLTTSITTTKFAKENNMEYSPAQTPEEDFVNLVRLELDDIKHTFFKIGFRLREANNERYFIKLGYESIEECAEALFGFKKTTTYDLMRLAELFADKMLQCQSTLVTTVLANHNSFFSHQSIILRITS